MSDRYWLKVLMVDGDDYGDKQWRYYYELHKGKKTIWHDYTKTMPKLSNVLKELEKE